LNDEPKRRGVSSQLLVVEHRGEGVVVVTLDRPEKRNALNAELRQALIDSLQELALDDGVRAVVLTGAGSTFCAGFDLEELMSAEQPAEIFTHANKYHEAVHTFAKPLIAAVEGAAVAGGMDLALMCDLRVVSTDAQFGQPQVRAGVPVAFELLATVIAEPAARELCLTGRVITSAEALSLGLIHRSTEPGAALDEAVAWAHEIADVAGAIGMKQTFVSAQPTLFT
jgi:enoyl-CoA hydratase